MHMIDQQLNLMIRGRFDEAWSLSEKLHEEDPNDIRHMFNRGWFLINQGDLQSGYQALEAGRHIQVYGDSHIGTRKPIWNNNDLIDKTVILALEGGLGDQIIYARFATEITDRGGTCIVCCDHNLHSVILRTPGVSKCITRDEVQSTHHDYWIPGFSCSWLFGHTFDNLPNEPYIFANPESVEIWKSFIKSDKPKIGIRWSGNPKFEHQQFRIFPAEPLIDLNKYDELQFYSLQRDADTRELPDNIIDLEHMLISWEDTIAAMANLDLVITSCTSIAHAASAMGIPTWVIVPILPYHIWAYGGEKSPWYKNTTVIRQKKFSDWDEAFVNLENMLVEKFDLKRK